jgi:hypothetical protein
VKRDSKGSYEKIESGFTVCSSDSNLIISCKGSESQNSPVQGMVRYAVARVE